MEAYLVDLADQVVLENLVEQRSTGVLLGTFCVYRMHMQIARTQ